MNKSFGAYEICFYFFLRVTFIPNGLFIIRRSGKTAYCKLEISFTVTKYRCLSCVRRLVECSF